MARQAIQVEFNNQVFKSKKDFKEYRMKVINKYNIGDSLTQNDGDDFLILKEMYDRYDHYKIRFGEVKRFIFKHDTECYINKSMKILVAITYSGRSVPLPYSDKYEKHFDSY